MTITLAKSMYSRDAILRTTYEYTGHHTAHITETEHAYEIHLDTNEDIREAFLKDLLLHTLRAEVREETRAVRELIIAQALAEGDLLG